MRLSDAIDLGIGFYRAGKYPQATEICRQLLTQLPNEPLTLNLTGLIAHATNQLDAAIAYFSKAIQVSPNIAEFHNNLGLALAARDRLDDAMNEYQIASQLKPDYGEALYNLADVLCIKRRWTEALAVFERAAMLRAHDPQSARNLATALMQTGQYEKAAAQARAALQMEPGHAAVHVNLGISLKALGDIDGAMSEYESAVVIQPNCLEALNNMANIYRETGRVRSAIDCYQRAIDCHPQRAEIGSNRLYALHYEESYDAPALLREHRQWAERYAAPLAKEIRPHENDRSPDRRLRIGYVSHNLNAHVVGVNLFPLLRGHDHEQVEVFCYSGVADADRVTLGLKACSDGWREIHSLDDRQTAELIRADKIDILVDLTVHMAYNRMLVFARKPAPVQVTYLGYCSTTGLDTIDYRLSDPDLDPPDSDLSSYTEKTARLPGGYWCYQPTEAPPIAPAPFLRNGYVTFGCQNNFSKVSPGSLDLWAQILRSIPNSRLILHCLPGSYRNGVLERFAAAGVTADRVEMVGFQKSEQYLQTYHRIDVALDPFPYGGGITTLDGLWMGVPLISLSGQTAVGRGGRSILSNIGLPELVAKTPQEYAELARDFGRWIQLRPDLRQRMQASPLLDPKRLARDVEGAFREMWKTWCR
jgi:predicted O-linked N-acetylglucosamine transferase (SPINDLY family)